MRGALGLIFALALEMVCVTTGIVVAHTREATLDDQDTSRRAEVTGTARLHDSVSGQELAAGTQSYFFLPTAQARVTKRGRLMADLGLGRDARFYEELGTKEDVQRLLDSQFVQEKLQGIKSVMAMAALGRDIGKP